MSFEPLPARGDDAPTGERLADHDVESLAAWLAGRCGQRLGTSRQTAGRALRLGYGAEALGAPAGSGEWSRRALAEASIGAWAHDALLSLPRAPCLTPLERVRSTDGTIRWLLQAADGELTESVIIPAARDRLRPRTTLCLSSQVGCARACRFCESGRHGLRRQLSSAEIVDQFRLLRAWWHAEPDGGEVSNVVLMGMGEPFDNLGAVLRAVRLLCDPRTFGFAPSRLTVSTVGIADKLRDFFAGSRAELAISLGAPDDERRRWLIPAAARYDLATLRQTLLETMPPRRRVLFQYTLFVGINDGDDDARTLAEYVRPVHCRVNVIGGNAGPDPTLVPPAPEAVESFARRLQGFGVATIIRRARGRDVGAACGQLAGAYRARSAATTLEPPLTPPTSNASEAPMALNRNALLARLASELPANGWVALAGLAAAELAPRLAPGQAVRWWPGPQAPPSPDLAVVVARRVSDRGELEPVAPADAGALAKAPRLLAVLLPSDGALPAMDDAAGSLVEAGPAPDAPSAEALLAYRVLSPWAVLDVEQGRFVVRELCPGLSARELQEAVTAPLAIASDVAEMVVPVVDESNHGMA